MTAESTVHLDDSCLAEADMAAVFEHVSIGSPLDPAVAERVRERANRVTLDIRRTHGTIDDSAFQSLLDDDA